MNTTPQFTSQTVPGAVLAAEPGWLANLQVWQARCRIVSLGPTLGQAFRNKGLSACNRDSANNYRSSLLLLYASIVLYSGILLGAIDSRAAAVQSSVEYRLGELGIDPHAVIFIERDIASRWDRRFPAMALFFGS